MLVAHVRLAALWHLTERCLTRRVSVHRWSCLHRAGGAVRWRSSCRPAPVLTATPARALIDERITIEGRFLPPHGPVTVTAHMHSEDGDLWEALAHYNADGNGVVNLSGDHSVGGSYLGCDPMGLFWSLQPAPGEREGLRLRKKDVRTPYQVHLSLLGGHVSKRSKVEQLAGATVERHYMAPGVRRIEIRQDGIVGTLFLPCGPGPFPAMVDLWGMGGGLNEYRSALFASRGYASLSLAYFGHKDLPGRPTTLNVGDNYFKSAYQLLQDHPQVCGDRVGFIGLSFGVYLSLRLATQTGVHPKCVICINGPIGTMNQIIDVEGREDGFDSDQTHWTFDEQGHVSFRVISLPANIPPENKIKMEDLQCPLLYMAGEDDMSCAALENADVMEQQLRAVGKAGLFTLVSYPGAGHLIEPPYAPNVRTSLWSVKPKKLITVWGGHLAPHAAAQEDSWEKTLEFMERHLRG